jgi:DnaJ family protein C protein 9
LTIDSQEEDTDVVEAYISTGGSLGDIMRHIPHSTHEDETRYITLIDSLIAQGKLESLLKWTKSSKDEKARLVRAKQAAKEASEAEALARELGVWDEFYGSGKEGARKGKGKGSKGKGKSPQKRGGTADAGDEDEEDTSALQALILKRKKNMDGFFDGLAAKYAEPDRSAKSTNARGKKRAKGEDEELNALPKKKPRVAPPPDIDDAEFSKLQAKLFGDKATPSSTSETKGKKGAKGRKAK